MPYNFGILFTVWPTFSTPFWGIYQHCSTFIMRSNRATFGSFNQCLICTIFIYRALAIKGCLLPSPSLSLFSPLPFSLSSRPLALLLNMRIICGPHWERERQSERRLCWRQRRQAARFRHISHFAAKSIKPEMHVVTSSHTSPAHTCCIRLAQEINLTSGQSARAAKGQEGWPGQAG